MEEMDKNEYTFHYFFSQDKTKKCCLCSYPLDQEFLVSARNSPIEKWSKPHWFTGKHTWQKEDHWAIAWETAVCFGCIHRKAIGG